MQSIQILYIVLYCVTLFVLFLIPASVGCIQLFIYSVEYYVNYSRNAFLLFNETKNRISPQHFTLALSLSNISTLNVGTEECIYSCWQKTTKILLNLCNHTHVFLTKYFEETPPHPHWKIATSLCIALAKQKTQFCRYFIHKQTKFAPNILSYMQETQLLFIDEIGAAFKSCIFTDKHCSQLLP